MKKKKINQIDYTNNSQYKEYIEKYYENEYDANRKMSFALAFTALLLLGIYIMALVGLFRFTTETFILLNVVYPVVILILLTPLIYIKTNKIRKPNYKYFILFSYIFVMAILNIMMPKHAIMGWAICIILTNHFYNPKVGKTVFIVTAISMLFCIYAAMFLGEFDSNLLMGELHEKEGLIYSTYLPGQTFSDLPLGRYQYLTALKEAGSNRYLTAFLFYFLARFVCLSIIFYISNSLNKRTNKLLFDEIKVNSAQQKTKTELEVAKEIQIQTLPKEIVITEDVEIQAELKAASQVGGDFYDYFKLDDTHYAILIGDVSGKGIGAAMFMMKAITCFKNYASIRKSPAQTLKAVNRVLFDVESNMFVTCLYAIVDIETGLVKFSNCGHLAPVVGQKGKYHYISCKTGFILGALEEAMCFDEEFYLNPGDSITLYTDGITEARNLSGEFYGEKRLLDFFNRKEYSCLLELHAELKDDIALFTEGAEQSDDITYITLRYHGDDYNYQEKIFDISKDEVKDMLDFLKQFGTKNKFDKSYINNMLVVGDEMLSNIVKYGYQEQEGNIYIRALYNKSKKEAILTIIDTGVEFNPLLSNATPISGDISEQKEGGLGILIVKTLMTECAYDRINNKNILTLKKQF